MIFLLLLNNPEFSKPSYITTYHCFQLELVWQIPKKIFDATIGIQKGSPYIRFMNHEITKLRGSGMLQRFLSRPNSKNSVCNNSDTNEDLVSLSFEKVIFLFAIILLGSVFAILLLFAEKSFSYFNPSKKKVKVKIGSKTRYIYEK